MYECFILFCCVSSKLIRNVLSRTTSFFLISILDDYKQLGSETASSLINFNFLQRYKNIVLVLLNNKHFLQIDDIGTIENKSWISFLYTCSCPGRTCVQLSQSDHTDFIFNAIVKHTTVTWVKIPNAKNKQFEVKVTTLLTRMDKLRS